MSKLIGLIELVQIAIDKGATSVEEVHRALANEPLEILKKIDFLNTPLKGIQDIQNLTIGSVYNIIRTINQEVSKIAKELLEKIEQNIKDSHDEAKRSDD